MDSNNRNTNNENSSQNESDIQSVEPITPKKNIQSNGSLFGKAKGLFGKKDAAEPQFHVRKEPTFGDAAQAEPTQNVFVPHDSLKSTTETTAQPDAQANAQNAQEETEAQTSLQFDEPVRESAHSNTASTLTQPEKWKMLQILPTKHRRLFLAILVLVILLIIFFALKPNSDTVESFTQQNGNEIPVQFQSLDQTQPVETTILDQQTQVPTAENPQAQETTPATNGTDNAPQTESAGNNANALISNAQSQPAAQPAQSTAENNAAIQPAAPAQSVSKPTPIAPAVQPSVSVTKSEPTRSAVEKPTVSTPSIERKATAEKAPAHSKTTGKAQVVEAKPIQVKEHKVKVVEAKPINSKATKTAAPQAASGKSKTLTVPQGVSLMQVFRDNQLNISDVNAMTKANGAGNALSSFKPGDKVTVSVNTQGRVAELRMSNGARFIRQADGSYQYKK